MVVCWVMVMVVHHHHVVNVISNHHLLARHNEAQGADAGITNYRCFTLQHDCPSCLIVSHSEHTRVSYDHARGQRARKQIRWSLGQAWNLDFERVANILRPCLSHLKHEISNRKCQLLPTTLGVNCRDR